MQIEHNSITIRVFVSSPGDVDTERKIALKVLDQVGKDLLSKKISLEAIAWDQPEMSTPLLAAITPQEAIDSGLVRPSDCDIVVVIFWSRMGTPLPFPQYKKANGERYLSGTEWEFEEAVTASRERGRPKVLLYRRTEELLLGVKDIEIMQKYEQWQRVENFFSRFQDTETGTILQGYNQYDTPESFGRDFEIHLRKLIDQIIEETLRQTKPKVTIDLPLLEFCLVPSGEVEIQDRVITVPSFKMSKFPITYSQYEAFVNSDGYKNNSYWSGLGWDWKTQGSRLYPERYWYDTKWHKSDHPVVGVTWYEALAFCNWLGTQLKSEVTLPTEWQWQLAAQGPDKCIYPWGNTFDSQKCNTADSTIGGTTSVYKYQESASYYNIYDMVGNAAEWCINEYDPFVSIELEKNSPKVIRGGSWRHPSIFASNITRQSQLPYDRSYYCGFRVIMKY
ncbi:MAG: hypothetical protein DPW16_07790 [Chloroflexi bacterium]|nr:hypothetical protein [Chloroflexota bacterium]